MKKRIEQLLNGKFEYETPELLMAPEELEVKVVPGKAVRGTFALAGRDGRKIRGFIYSSNPRMRCEPIEFQGVRAGESRAFLQSAAISENTICRIP